MKDSTDKRKAAWNDALLQVRPEFLEEAAHPETLLPTNTLEGKHRQGFRWILIAAAAILLVGVMFTASILGNVAWKKYHPVSSASIGTFSPAISTETPETTRGPEETTSSAEQTTTPETEKHPELPNPGQTIMVTTSSGTFTYGMNSTQTGWLVGCNTIPADATEVVFGEPYLGIPVYEIVGASADIATGQPIHVIIHPDVQKIGPNAFNGCTWMETLTFSKNLKSINVKAFANNPTLKLVAWDVCGLEWVGDDIFSGSKSCYHEHVPIAQPLKQEVDCLGYPTMLAVCRLCSERYTFVDSTAQEEPTNRHIWETVDSVEPTCISSGCSGRYCSLCGKDERVTLPPLGHNFDADGNCTRCGVSETGLAFELAEDGQSYICLGCAQNFEGTELIVPAEYRGKPVTKVWLAEVAYQSNEWILRGGIKDTVTKIVLPSTVKRLEHADAYGADFGGYDEYENITEIVLPEGLEYIGNVMFHAQITELVIPSTVKQIEGFAFACCNKLTTLDIRCKDAEIAESAFIGVEVYDRMMGYDGPLGLEWDLVMDIGPKEVCLAGLGTYEGTVLHIPDTYHGVNVRMVRENALRGNTTLEELTLPATINYVQCGTDGFYTLANCTALKKVVFQDREESSPAMSNSVLDIGIGYFDGCTALETLILPKRLETIAADAFHGCTSLKVITFLGTKAQWQEVMKLGKSLNPYTYPPYFMEIPPAGMTVRCSDGDIVY